MVAHSTSGTATVGRSCRPVSTACHRDLHVLGPLLFSLYVAPIADVIKSFDVSHARYADDTRLYMELSRASSQSLMNDYFHAVHNQFALNGRSLNPDRSEAIVIDTGARRVRLGDSDITISGSVRSLGVTIDSTMSFDEHVNDVCKASYCRIRAFRRIRKIITTAAAVVSSRLDYCNALLRGTSAATVNKLQRAQNSLAQ